MPSTITEGSPNNHLLCEASDLGLLASRLAFLIVDKKAPLSRSPVKKKTKKVKWDNCFHNSYLHGPLSDRWCTHGMPLEGLMGMTGDNEDLSQGCRSTVGPLEALLLWRGGANRPVLLLVQEEEHLIVGAHSASGKAKLGAIVGPTLQWLATALGLKLVELLNYNRSGWRLRVLWFERD